MSSPSDNASRDRDPLTDPLPADDDTATRPIDRGTGDTGTRAIDRGADEAVVTRHEERARVEHELHETGRVRVRKNVETVPVEEVVPRNVEQVDFSERMDADENDTGEVITLEDGSVSIPVFEEVLVVTKKLVVRERVIVRKETVVDEYRLQTELRREHVTVDDDSDNDSGLVQDVDSRTDERQQY
jgi:uncharacterized protein (TIGR02271 family)